MRELRGRTAVVSGAARGLGRAVALELASRGSHLALVDVDEAGLAEVASLVQGQGVSVSIHPTDVADPSAVTRAGEAILEAHGAVHLVVTAAGVTAAAPVATQAPAELARVLAVNLNGTVHLCQAFLPTLLAQGEGQLVLISSAILALGSPWQAAYCASKAGVAAFGDGLALELGGTGVQVTTVFPGLVRTGIIAAAPFVDAARREQLDAWMQRRGRDPAAAARELVDRCRPGPSIVHLGWDARLLFALAGLPFARRVVRWLMGWFLARESGGRGEV